MKKLKLRIVKFERALAMQVLEMQNLNESITFSFYPTTEKTMYPVFIAIRKNLDVDVRAFNDNTERDEYLNKMLGWITEELFGGDSKLEVGKMCDVSDDGKTWTQRIYAGKVDKHFGEEKRFLAFYDLNNYTFARWEYAKPIEDCLSIDGDVYTWEK